MTALHRKKRIVVIGGGYAGLLAALRLSQKTDPQTAEMLLIDGADHFVERIRLHQLAANQSLKQYPYCDLLKGSQITFMQGWVSRLSPRQQTITVQNSSDQKQVTYDYLIYALGSQVDAGRIPGLAEHAMTLGSEQTTLDLQTRLPEVAERGGRLLVCGGGLTGLEAATELAEAYPSLQVTLVTQGEFGQQLSRQGQQHLRRVFARLGIEVIDQVTITHFRPDAVEGAEGETIAFDLALWAGPFTVPALARDSGLEVNPTGQIVVDEQLRARSQPNIYAVGDSATLEAALDKPIRMACATASPMGLYAADHLAAKLAGQPEPEPYRFNYVMRCISLGRHDALIQWVQPDDTPKERITAGWLGARIKELVCRSTIWTIQLERLRAALADWFKRRSIPGPKLVGKEAS